MSHERRTRYDYEARRRRELYLQSLERNVESSLISYKGSYDNMVKQDFASYVPTELRRLQADLEKIDSRLRRGDPEGARDTLNKVSSYIHGMYSLVNAIKQKQYEAERLARKKEQEEQRRLQQRQEEERRLARQKAEEEKRAALTAYYNSVNTIEDPVVSSIARVELNALKLAVQNGKLKADGVKVRFKEIVAAAMPKAEAWKQAELQANAKDTLAQKLQAKLETVKSQSFEDKKQQECFVKQLQELQQDLKLNKTSIAAIEDGAVKIEQKALEHAVDESVRRETVKAIILQLQSQGFTINSPRLQEDGYVYVQAQMPAGKQVLCKISADGVFQYRFEHYEGMSCLKDIEKFNVELDKIYGVKLSEERVLWENPDRLQMDAESQIGAKRRNE